MYMYTSVKSCIASYMYMYCMCTYMYMYVHRILRFSCRGACVCVCVESVWISLEIIQELVTYCTDPILSPGPEATALGSGGPL